MEDLRAYINKLRHDFSKGNLDEKEVDKNPVLQFEKWFKQAVEAHESEPNAMVVSTVSVENKPSSRILLLRNFDDAGFVFYTNYDSKKANDIKHNPNVCINFFWQGLERQVRIEGTIAKQTDEESDLYFNSRPRTSQLGAWTSPQSRVISGRDFIETELQKTEQKFADKNVNRPEFWGGYIVKPTYFEFWQGRPSRLHDRLSYTLSNNNWLIERLAP